MTKAQTAYELREKGMSYNQIAEIIGSSPSSVSNLLSYKRKKLGLPRLPAGRPRKRVTLADLEYPRASQADIQAWWKARGY